MTFSCEENLTTETRSWSSGWTIALQDRTVTSERCRITYTVVQQGKPTVVTLTTDVEDISANFTAAAGTVKVTSNYKWKAMTDAPWITLSNECGAEEGNFKYAIAYNGERRARKGEIVIQADNVERRITVMQDAYSTPDLRFGRPDGWVGSAYLTNARGDSTPKNYFVKTEKKRDEIFLYFGLANGDRGKIEGTLTFDVTIIDGLGIVIHRDGLSKIEPVPQPLSVSPMSYVLPPLDIGSYKILCQIDEENRIDETYEDNNTVEIPFFVVPSLPDPMPDPVYCKGDGMTPDPVVEKSFGPGRVSSFPMENGVTGMVAGVSGLSWKDFVQTEYHGERSGIGKLSFPCFADDRLVDAEKNNQVDSDDYWCPALADVNLLVWGGWAAWAGFEDEDQLADFLRSKPDLIVETVDDVPQWDSAVYGQEGLFDWFAAETGVKLHDSEYVTYFTAGDASFAASVEQAVAAGDRLVKMSVWFGDYVWKGERGVGHAVTCCGCAVDPARPSGDPKRLVGLFVIDSDNDLHSGEGAGEAPDAITYCPVSWNGTAFVISNVFGTQGEIFGDAYALVKAPQEEPNPPPPSDPDFEYEASFGEFITILGYRGTERNVVIPSEIEGLPVRRIDRLRPDESETFDVDSVTLPNSLEVIAQFAFSGCDKLTSIRIPASVNYIQEPYLAFYRCASLRAIEVALENAEYKSENGCLLSKDGEILLLVSPGLSSVDIPAGVKIVGDNAFSDGRVVSVNIPEGVEEVRPFAFAGAADLSDVSIPATVRKIGKYAFWKASSLKEVRFVGNAPECGESLYEDTAESLVTHVKGGSTGWLEADSPKLPDLWPVGDEFARRIVCDDQTPEAQSMSIYGAGWHEVSFNVLSEGGKPEDVFASVEDKIDYVTYGSQNWNPLRGGTLTALEIGKGYWVQTTAENVSWTVTGQANPGVEIALKAGWNLIGYPLLEEGEIETVLATALATGNIRYIYSGSRVYPGTLTTMTPGKGYWVYAEAAGLIRFDFNG